MTNHSATFIWVRQFYAPTFSAKILDFVITEAGRELLPVVAMMMDFGNKYFYPHGIDTVIIHKETKKLMSPTLIDNESKKLINYTTAEFAADPDATEAKRGYFRARGLPLLERT